MPFCQSEEHSHWRGHGIEQNIRTEEAAACLSVSQKSTPIGVGMASNRAWVWKLTASPDNICCCQNPHHSSHHLNLRATGRRARCPHCKTVRKQTCLPPAEADTLSGLQGGSRHHLHGHKVQEVVGQHGKTDVHTQLESGVLRVVQQALTHRVVHPVADRHKHCRGRGRQVGCGRMIAHARL